MRASLFGSCWLAALTVLATAHAAAVSPGGKTPSWENPSSEPLGLQACNGLVYFSADDGTHGRELWRSDGTPEGTILIGDIVRGAQSSDPELVLTSGNPVLVSISYRRPNSQFRFQEDLEIWTSDGTPEGTVPVVNPSGDVVGLRGIDLSDRVTTLDGQTYIAYAYEQPYSHIWRVRTDGTLEDPGARLPDGLDNVDLHHIVGSENAIVGRGIIQNFVSGDQAVDCLVRLFPGEAIYQVLPMPLQTDGRLVGVYQDQLLLRARRVNEGLGLELWISDVTEAGTHMIRDLSPGPLDSGPNPMFSILFQDRAYFAWPNTLTGSEVFVTDGTHEGTHVVADLNVGESSSFPGYLEVVGDRIFFQANLPETGKELWVTDGTAEGTRLVADINPGKESSDPFRFAVLGDRLAFTASQSEGDGELWISDGTKPGTYRVKDIRAGSEGAWPYDKAVIGDMLLFSANDGVHGEELWVSDGTAAGTRLLKDIYPVQGPNPSSDPQQLIRMGEKLFFVVNDGRYGAELWVTDGTSDGTKLVKDIFEGPPSASPAELFVFNGNLYFQADDGQHGVELWCSDGTTEGTYLVHDLNPGTASSYPHELTARTKSRFGMVATSAKEGTEYFEHDTENPFVVYVEADIVEGSESSNPADLVAVEMANGQSWMYFTADDGRHGRELWVFTGYSYYLVSDLVTSQAMSGPRNLVGGDGRLYFTADDSQHGIELFSSDGTPTGTELVADIVAPR